VYHLNGNQVIVQIENLIVSHADWSFGGGVSGGGLLKVIQFDVNKVWFLSSDSDKKKL